MLRSLMGTEPNFFPTDRVSEIEARNRRDFTDMVEEIVRAKCGACVGGCAVTATIAENPKDIDEPGASFLEFFKLDDLVGSGLVVDVHCASEACANPNVVAQTMEMIAEL